MWCLELVGAVVWRRRGWRRGSIGIGRRDGWEQWLIERRLVERFVVERGLVGRFVVEQRLVGRLVVEQRRR
jgi:hypothetical protein